MISRRPDHRDPRKFKFSIWPFVAGLLLLTSAVGAQITDTTSRSKLVGSIAPRTKDFRASFTYGPKYPLQGEGVQFMETSTGNPTSWLWDFGDGSKSTARNPSHAYASPGFWKVTLIASNGADSRKSFKTVTVMAESTSASFSFTPSTPGPGQLVAFTDLTPGPPTSWRWDFGDGSTSAAKNPTHVYPAAASYTVTLTTNDGSGPKQASKVIRVVSMSLLTASFTYSPNLPVAGRAVQFTDMSAGSPTAWLWDFGDGKASTVQHPAHIFAAPGFYTAKLTAKSGSESKTASHSITVVAIAAPEAAFSFNPASPVAGQPVAFTDASIGDPTSWQWQFGDGGSSVDRNPGHAYANSGSYTVTLTATSSSGSGSLSQTISVLPATSLAADFAYAPASPVLGQAVAFMDASTGTPDSWLWEFGDGATSSLRSPSYAYTAAGVYSVTLTVTSGPNSSRLSKTLSIGYADVITAASPSFVDVSTAIAGARAGDTVMVPAGQAVWNSQLVITKGIRLIGAGIGQTIISGNYTPLAINRMSYKSWLVVYKPANPELNEPFRLSGFEFDAGSKCYGIFLTNLSLNVINQVRVDHTKVVNCFGSRPFSIYGTVYGVADNNEWHGCYISASDARDEETWAAFSFDYGTADNFYYEDNKFIGVDYLVLRSEMGGRWSVRYNLFDGRAVTSGLYSLMDIHGNAPSAHWAAMGAEIYENTILAPDNGGTLLDQRGGKALVYNNLVTSAGSFSTKVREEYSDENNPIAGPSKSPAGQPQHVSESYYWGNRRNTAKIITPYISSSFDYGGVKGLVPQQNREFWTENPSFDGATGVGIGILADRPITCAKGVAYWATDTKTLYRCSFDNVWAPYYTPYAYPHPLRALLIN